MKRLLGLGFGLLITVAAGASTLDFATVHYMGMTGSNVTYEWRNDGSDFLGLQTGIGSSIVSIPVVFKYVGDTPPTGFTGGVAAHMTIVAPATGPAVITNGIDEQITGGTIAITLDGAADGSNLLLGVQFNGLLSGADNSADAQLVADTVKGDSVTFTSDFAAFTGGFDESLLFNFNSVSPNLAIDANQYLRTFMASGTGTFRLTPSSPTPPDPVGTPEPPEFILTLLGSGMILVGAIRKRIKR